MASASSSRSIYLGMPKDVVCERKPRRHRNIKPKDSTDLNKRIVSAVVFCGVAGLSVFGILSGSSHLISSISSLSSFAAPLSVLTVGLYAIYKFNDWKKEGLKKEEIAAVFLLGALALSVLGAQYLVHLNYSSIGSALSSAAPYLSWAGAIVPLLSWVGYKIWNSKKKKETKKKRSKEQNQARVDASIRRKTTIVSPSSGTNSNAPTTSSSRTSHIAPPSSETTIHRFSDGADPEFLE